MAPQQRNIAFIILAAGLGSRLQSVVSGKPKWMVDLGPHATISSNQLDALDRIGADAPRVVVTGAHSEVIEEFRSERVSAGLRGFETCFNKRYSEWNNWYSLVIGLRRLDELGWDGPTVVVNGDLFCPQDWITAFADTVDEWPDASLIVDASKPLTDEAMKVEVQDGLVRKVGKVGLSNPTGEYIGFAGLTATGRKLMLEASKELRAIRTNDWYEGALQIAIDNGLWASAWVSPAEPWVEVDNDEDLAFGRSIASS